ncbi:MAG: amidase [Acetobacteraceae bacterium]|nr:amidase [Acetobacteraceae bacterium]
MSGSRGPAMGWDEWARHDATALAALVRRGEISARQIAAQVAEGVGRVDARIGAVLGLFDDVVANPDTNRPNRAGVLYGVPVLVKDLGQAMAGRMQESGSKLWRGYVPTANDPLIDNVLAAGLVPIGRSTAPEFGMTFDTATDYQGTVKVTRNPWNPAHTPGGSSGGSAAAVAAGVTPISLSSDGGGSTRIPASFCGLVGLKAARGRVPRPLGQNEYVTRIAIDGVLTRSVRDTAAAYETLSRVPNGGTFMPLRAPKLGYLAALAIEPGRLRVGLSTGDWGRTTPTDPQVAARVGEVGLLMQSLGHHVEEVDDAAICDWGVMWRGYITQWIGSRAAFVAMARERGVEPQELGHVLSRMTYRHFLAHSRYDKFDIFAMMAANNTTTRSFGRLMERYDVLLTPTLAVRVPPANGPYSLLADEELDPWVGRLADACRYTMPGNETGMPAISLPAGLDAEGLPIGVQVHGNFACEDVLIQVAAQIERAKPDWFTARPGVHVAG